MCCHLHPAEPAPSPPPPHPLSQPQTYDLEALTSSPLSRHTDAYPRILLLPLIVLTHIARITPFPDQMCPDTNPGAAHPMWCPAVPGARAGADHRDAGMGSGLCTWLSRPWERVGSCGATRSYRTQQVATPSRAVHTSPAPLLPHHPSLLRPLQAPASPVHAGILRFFSRFPGWWGDGGRIWVWVANGGTVPSY